MHPPHRIQRQIVELVTHDSRFAHALQARISALQPQLEKVIDEVLTQLDPSDAITVFDHVQVDLGELPADDLERALLAALPKALARAIGKITSPSPLAAPRRAPALEVTRALELVEGFATGGVLPWWAPRRDPQVVSRHLASLVGAAPQRWTALAMRLAKRPLTLRRLAQHSDPTVWWRAIAAVAGQPESRVRHLSTAAQTALRPVATHPAATIRRVVDWQLLLAAISGDLDQTVLTHSAARALGVRNAPPAMSEAFPRQTTSDGDPMPRGSEPSSAGPTQASAPSTLEAPRQPQPSSEDPPHVRPPFSADAPSSEAHPAQTPSPPSSEAPRPPSIPEGPSADPRRAHPLAQPEEVYVSNAGLVLLWPFLERLFEHAGLTEHRSFRDDGAAHRAACLLWALCTNEREPLEFQLALCKALCGVPLSTVIVVDTPVTDEEQDEADRLVTSVIGHVPALGAISEDGFRGTFLVREGVLGVRDGAWLLQVERHPQDVLLERFPWSWAWVKLPWMDSPLRVGVVSAAELALTANAQVLERELAWLGQVIDARFRLYFNNQPTVSDVTDLAPPAFETETASAAPFARFVNDQRLSFAQRVLTALVLATELRPQLLDVFYLRNLTFDRPFAEFGGIRSSSQRFIPTGETLAFILGGNSLHARFETQRMLEPDQALLRSGVVVVAAQPGQSPLRAALELGPAWLGRFTLGRSPQVQVGPDFPAMRIETQLRWSDLVLHPGTMQQVEEIRTWIDHHDTLMNAWGMARKLRPGYRALFHGPPGTGKTMTACLLGQSTGPRRVPGSTCPWSSRSISAKPKKTSPGYSTRLSGRAGFSFLMKAKPCLDDGEKRATPAIVTPTRRYPSCCSASRSSMESPFSHPT